jgi:GTP-binding protein Era
MSEETTFRSGFVALIGLPNVGKSTLLNALLEFRLSIVSPSPQTTRHKILGILNGSDHQICFLDTPGLLGKADDSLQDILIKATRSAIKQDADLLIVVVAPGKPSPETLAQLKKTASAGKPIILVVNKSDIEADKEKLSACAKIYEEALPISETHFLSALKKNGTKELREAIARRLPLSRPFYGKDQMSDRWERFFVSEIVREALFDLYRAEVPHACAVEIEQFKERKGRPDQIRATIFVERATQKAILLGKGGKALRKLGAKCRAAVGTFLGRRADLELWIKVRPSWRRDKTALKELGYSP